MVANPSIPSSANPAQDAHHPNMSLVLCLREWPH
jgi:hypothetical protein